MPTTSTPPAYIDLIGDPATKTLVGSFLASLARMVSEGDHSDFTTTRHALENAVSLLRDLDYLRGSAEGILKLYSQIPILESVQLRVSNDGESFSVTLDELHVVPGSVAHGQELAFTDALAAYFDDLSVSLSFADALDNLSDIELLSCDGALLWSALEGTGISVNVHGDEWAVNTSRGAVQAALDAGGLDALAQALFPTKWAEVTDRLVLLQREDTATDGRGSRPRPR